MLQGSIAARLKRIARIAAPAFAALGVLMTTPAQSQQTARVVAVGDLHGDFKAWTDIARAAGLVDARGRWAGGKTVLVQMGDIVDRGPDSLKIIRNLIALQREAARKGGKVVIVLGNHEAMMVLDDTRYTTPAEFAAFVDKESASRRDQVYEANRASVESFYRTQDPKITPEQARTKWMAEHPLGWLEHKLAWAPSGELGKWAASNPAIVWVGGTLFAHGGISTEYARQPLNVVNKRIAAAMAAGDDSPASVLTDALGPLWYRGLVAADPEAQAARAAVKPPTPALTTDQELDAALTAYNAKRLVVGHTPNLKGIQITNNGRLARIDTGNSAYYGGTLSWLEITGGQMIPHTVARTP